MLEKLAPALFVLLWSTGWIAAKYAAPHADPEVFLTLRFGLSVVAFGALALVSQASWPANRTQFVHAIWSGLFLHGFYLGGLWWAIARGVPASLSGLIAALQPLLTALAASVVLKEELKPLQKAGLALGFAGLLIAILPKLLGLTGQALAEAGLPLAFNLLSMAAVTYGTIYQKRHLQSGDLRSIATLQYLGGTLVVLMAAVALGETRFDSTPQVWLAMLWSVFGLSMGAVGLLLFLIRRGQVSRAASLIYLMPPAVALEAMLMFGETLTPAMIAGTVVVVTGVWMINR